MDPNPRSMQYHHGIDGNPGPHESEAQVLSWEPPRCSHWQVVAEHMHVSRVDLLMANEVLITVILFLEKYPVLVNDQSQWELANTLTLWPTMCALQRNLIVRNMMGTAGLPSCRTCTRQPAMRSPRLRSQLTTTRNSRCQAAWYPKVWCKISRKSSWTRAMGATPAVHQGWKKYFVSVGYFSDILSRQVADRIGPRGSWPGEYRICQWW